MWTLISPRRLITLVWPKGKIYRKQLLTSILHNKGGNRKKNCYLALYETPQGTTNTGNINLFSVVFLSEPTQELPVNQIKCFCLKHTISNKSNYKVSLITCKYFFQVPSFYLHFCKEPIERVGTGWGTLP